MAGDNDPNGTDDGVNILNIDTMIKRPQIVIDGKFYDLSSPEELSLLDTHRVVQWGKRLDTLMKKPELNDNEEKALASLLDKISAIIMAPVPATVRAALSETNKLAVMQVFTMLSLARKTKLAGAALTGMGLGMGQTMVPEKLMTAIGESLSPGSSASMAGSPAAG